MYIYNVQCWYCICIVSLLYSQLGIYGHQVIITVDVSEIPAFQPCSWNVQLFPGKPLKAMMISFQKPKYSKYGKLFEKQNQCPHPKSQLVPYRRQLMWDKQACNYHLELSMIKLWGRLFLEAVRYHPRPHSHGQQ